MTVVAHALAAGRTQIADLPGISLDAFMVAVLASMG